MWVTKPIKNPSVCVCAGQPTFRLCEISTGLLGSDLTVLWGQITNQAKIKTALGLQILTGHESSRFKERWGVSCNFMQIQLKPPQTNHCRSHSPFYSPRDLQWANRAVLPFSSPFTHSIDHCDVFKHLKRLISFVPSSIELWFFVNHIWLWFLGSNEIKTEREGEGAIKMMH